jgi:hypothetical protein
MINILLGRLFTFLCIVAATSSFAQIQSFHESQPSTDLGISLTNRAGADYLSAELRDGAQFLTIRPVIIDRSVAVSWVDFNRDGLLDFFVANGGPLNQDGQLNEIWLHAGDDPLFPFELILDGPVAEEPTNSMGASWGDYDNNGFPDLFLTNHQGFGDSHDLLYQNADGLFTRVTTGVIGNDGGESVSAAWADYDNDGYIDLFVANNGQPNFLYRNIGGIGFEKIASGEIVTDGSASYCGVWGDYDNDGFVDLFVANYGSDNFLYRNNGDGTFIRTVSGEIVTDGGFSYGASWGDYDNDEDLDLFVANDQQNNFLYRNGGDGSFEKIVDGPLVNDGGSSRGSAWGDCDNDGDLDLFVANSAGETNFLYLNSGDGTFIRDESDQLINAEAFDSFGAAWGDYNDDGALDLLVANWEGFPSFGANNSLHINSGNANSWLKIKCVARVSNASAIGVQVRALATVAGESHWQLREIASLTGFGSQNSFDVHFGLGDAAIVDSLKLEWPSGRGQSLANVAVNQFLTIEEPDKPNSVEEPAVDLPTNFQLAQNYPNPFNPSTRISYSLAAASFVTLKIYDLRGRELATLVNGHQPAGEYEIDFHADNLANGIFFYRLQAGSFTETRKMIMIR